MSDFIKKSEDVKKRYKIDEIRLKTLINVYGNLSKNDSLRVIGLSNEYKVLKIDCILLQDNNPYFELLYMYSVDTRELMGQIGTIVRKNSYSTGFNFTTTLNENGELGQVKIESFSE